MSAGAQLQMAPQTTIQGGGQQQQTVHNQDSNMSTGSSHSDKEIDSGGPVEQNNKQMTARTVKRKRKAPTDDNGGRGGEHIIGAGVILGSSGQVVTHQNSKGARVTSLNFAPDNKKINEYFKHSANSPIRQQTHSGAKSPSPQHTFPMYPPSPQTITNVVSQEFYKSRNPTSMAPASNMQQLIPPCPTPQSPMAVKVTAATQTDLTYTEISERDSEFEAMKIKVDELTRINEEQKCQISSNHKTIEQHKNHIKKCIDVVKKLLKEKSNIEKKEARQKCMQNKLQLGQFVTQRVGATFQENWTDGYAFQELARRQEEISAEREEIDRQKKLLMKKRPVEANTGRKRNASQTSQNANNASSSGYNSSPSVTASSTLGIGSSTVGGAGGTSNITGSTNSGNSSSGVHNGGDVTFLKPDPVAGAFTVQEYYESDEILKLRQNALKKEDADLQLEMEKLERERNLHIRELKRIHNEDQVSQIYNLFHYQPNTNPMNFIKFLVSI